MLFFSFIIFTTSCDNEDYLLALEGNWKLDRISGGLGGGGFEVDREVTMEIFEDKMVMRADDRRFMRARLSYEKGEYYDSIILEKENIPNEFDFFLPLFDELGIALEEDELSLSDLCNDCYQYHFKKEI